MQACTFDVCLEDEGLCDPCSVLVWFDFVLMKVCAKSFCSWDVNAINWIDLEYGIMNANYWVVIKCGLGICMIECGNRNWLD